jgi:hypothetical protein
MAPCCPSMTRQSPPSHLSHAGFSAPAQLPFLQHCALPEHCPPAGVSSTGLAANTQHSRSRDLLSMPGRWLGSRPTTKPWVVSFSKMRTLPTGSSTPPFPVTTNPGPDVALQSHEGCQEPPQTHTQPCTLSQPRLPHPKKGVLGLNAIPAVHTLKS